MARACGGFYLLGTLRIVVVVVDFEVDGGFPIKPSGMIVAVVVVVALG